MMATVDPADLQAAAQRHLWLHFARMGAYGPTSSTPGSGRDIPIFVRGEREYLFDDHDRRYLDGLSGLFTVQAGHGRAEIADAASRQGRELAYYPIWSAAHPAAIELAARLADLAPGNLNRVFFTSGGSEAGESGWEIGRAHLPAGGPPGRRQKNRPPPPHPRATQGAPLVT